MSQKLYMPRIIVAIILTLTAISASAQKNHNSSDNTNNAFSQGEVALYKIHFGFVNAGEATISVGDDIHIINDKPCYNLEVSGKTVGVFALAATLEDKWGTFVDTTSLLPEKFYLRVREMSYRKKQNILFEQSEDKAIVQKLNKETGEFIRADTFNVPSHIRDIVSGAYFLRTFNLDTLQIGNSIRIDGFFDDTVYNMHIKLTGKEIINTKAGKKEALVLSPILPNNKLFDGGDAIQIWLSDDTHKIPLKVKAKLLIGSLDITLKEYTPGIKHPENEDYFKKKRKRRKDKT
ncbi:DUF3108 domain-containing protein [Aureibacter tunicatorum]|uniref:DUF3108 domain-containing protein n=1 Tax=Aureibacter tunicatorum TaxID=866807 RepID=A0AAE4BTW0_9BACT|nr:DUF3108 domain-containing protein [Aureibacter tunicatorum]MDR6240193.1 hypothetical protein [Aureibacter tunicatorum]